MLSFFFSFHCCDEKFIILFWCFLRWYFKLQISWIVVLLCHTSKIQLNNPWKYIPHTHFRLIFPTDEKFSHLKSENGKNFREKLILANEKLFSYKIPTWFLRIFAKNYFFIIIRLITTKNIFFRIKMEFFRLKNFS